jgi:Ca-activated chloride channel family protein
MHLNATLDLDVVAIEAEDQISVLLELAAPAAKTSRTRPPSTLQVVLDVPARWPATRSSPRRPR